MTTEILVFVIGLLAGGISSTLGVLLGIRIALGFWVWPGKR